MTLNFIRIYELCKDKDVLLSRLREWSLIKAEDEYVCQKCNGNFTLCNDSSRIDGWRWYCLNNIGRNKQKGAGTLRNSAQVVELTKCSSEDAAYVLTENEYSVDQAVLAILDQPDVNVWKENKKKPKKEAKDKEVSTRFVRRSFVPVNRRDGGSVPDRRSVGGGYRDTPDSARNVGSRPRVAPRGFSSQYNAKDWLVNDASWAAIASLPTFSAAQSATVNHESSEAQSMAVNRDSSEAQSMAVNRESSEAQSVTVNRESNEAQSVIVNRESSEVQSVIVNRESSEAQSVIVNRESSAAQSVIVNREFSEAQSVTINREFGAAQSVIVSRESSVAQSMTINREFTDKLKNDLGLNLHHAASESPTSLPQNRNTIHSQASYPKSSPILDFISIIFVVPPPPEALLVSEGDASANPALHSSQPPHNSFRQGVEFLTGSSPQAVVDFQFGFQQLDISAPHASVVDRFQQPQLLPRGTALSFTDPSSLEYQSHYSRQQQPIPQQQAAAVAAAQAPQSTQQHSLQQQQMYTAATAQFPNYFPYHLYSPVAANMHDNLGSATQQLGGHQNRNQSGGGLMNNSSSTGNNGVAPPPGFNTPHYVPQQSLQSLFHMPSYRAPMPFPMLFPGGPQQQQQQQRPPQLPQNNHNQQQHMFQSQNHHHPQL